MAQSRPISTMTSLDAFRGIFALYIANFHVPWENHIFYIPFFEHGYPALDMFFILSGFLMLLLYEGQLKNRTQAWDFVKKRFGRIYPLHLFTLGLALCYEVARLIASSHGLAPLNPGEAVPLSTEAASNVTTFISNLFLTHGIGLHDALSFNGPSWSVSVEFYTYLVFAVVMLFAAPKKLWHYLLLAIGVAAIYNWLAKTQASLNISYDYGFLRCLAGFGAGMIACKLYETASAYFNNASYLFVSIVEFILFFSLLYWLSEISGKSAGTARLNFAVAPLLMANIIVFAYGRGVLSKFFAHTVFQYLGKISYSIYLNHVIIANVMYIGYQLAVSRGWSPTFLQGDLLLLLFFALVIVFSHFTYHYVEVPGGRFIRTLGRRQTPQSSA